MHFLILPSKCQKGDLAHTGTIVMKMLHARPLEWAEGTDFNPYFDDSNVIGIQVDINGDRDRETYQSFVEWLESLVPCNCIQMSDEEATSTWSQMSL